MGFPLSCRNPILVGLVLTVLLSIANCSHCRTVHSPLVQHQHQHQHPSWTLPGGSSLQNPPDDGALSTRGGAFQSKAPVPAKHANSNSNSNSNINKNVTKTPTPVKNAAIALGTVMTSYLLWIHRTSWMGFFNKEKLLETTLEILHKLDALPKRYSYTVYALGMASWETVGLSTIPVETAAGMVFGWPGFWLSASGKLMGAVIAFGLVRYGNLAEFVQRKFADNKVLGLLDESADTNPFLVSMLLKFSCFPETIKNFGSALLLPIQLWMFVLTTVFHGWTFSALWTYLGVDTAKRLADPSVPVDGKLQILLTLALFNGVVISPLTMAYWVKSLTKQSSLNKNAKKKTQG